MEDKLDSIRNPEGVWINSQVFREEALHFIKKGHYCPDPWGSPNWFDYWSEQRTRCIDGYSVGGVKITGEHYFYLNFCPIPKVVSIRGKKATKGFEQPDFWDYDYNYYWAREIARKGVVDSLIKKEDYHLYDNPTKEQLKTLYDSLQLNLRISEDHLLGGYNMIVGKSRRRGYSHKAAAIGARNFFCFPNSKTVLGASDKAYLFPEGLFSLTKDKINFINQNTGWATPSDEVDKQDHLKASYVTYIDGQKHYKGLMSEVWAATFHNNPDAVRGKDLLDLFFEEAGAFGQPGLLKDSYKASEDCVKASNLKTGMITIFGTSGDLSGGTYDYADMFSRPAAFDLLPFHNIWDKEVSNTFCGFWHGAQGNAEGFYDAQGNSDIEGATESVLTERQILIDAGATINEINKKMQERPLCPSEAFASASRNNFPTVELSAQLAKVKALGLQKKKGMCVNLVFDGPSVRAEPILNGKENPITSLHNLPTDIRGNVVIYEQAITGAEKGLYKIGYDPIRQDQGTSLAAIIVYKGVHKSSYNHSTIVAEYIGRLDSPDDIDKIAEMLAIYYNTTVMHENEVTGVKNYFRRIKRLDLLAHQPDAVISKNIKNSIVKRVYGCHMNDPLKDAGERYVKDWLLSVLDYGEDGKQIRVIDKIYSQRLLEELINYYRKGNFDLISSLFMCLFQVQEEALGKVYDEKKENTKVKNLLEMMDVLYK